MADIWWNPIFHKFHHIIIFSFSVHSFIYQFKNQEIIFCFWTSFNSSFCAGVLSVQGFLHDMKYMYCTMLLVPWGISYCRLSVLFCWTVKNSPLFHSISTTPTFQTKYQMLKTDVYIVYTLTTDTHSKNSCFQTSLCWLYCACGVQPRSLLSALSWQSMVQCSLATVGKPDE